MGSSNTDYNNRFGFYESSYNSCRTTHRGCIGFAVHGDRLDVQTAAGVDDATSDLAAVGDQHLIEALKRREGREGREGGEEREREEGGDKRREVFMMGEEES